VFVPVLTVELVMAVSVAREVLGLNLVVMSLCVMSRILNSYEQG
jgi:hypothetical protein